MAESDRTEEIQAFLQRQGAIGILSRIDVFGDRNKDLQEKVNVSSSTLSKRLQEARDLKLLTIQPQNTDYGTKEVYRLTQAGREVQSKINFIGLDDTYTRLETIEEQFENQRESLVDWAGDNQFSSKRWPWEPSD